MVFNDKEAVRPLLGRAIVWLSRGFGFAYIWVGVQHFTNTAWFEPIVPELLGPPAVWVYLTGIIEIALGVGLLYPAIRPKAALASAAFLGAVYWANLNMWVNDIPLDGRTYSSGWHFARLIAQVAMLGLSLFIWRAGRRNQEML